MGKCGCNCGCNAAVVTSKTLIESSKAFHAYESMWKLCIILYESM